MVQYQRRATSYCSTSNCAALNSVMLNSETSNIPTLKTHRQISKKWYFEKYCLYDKACQFSAL